MMPIKDPEQRRLYQRAYQRARYHTPAGQRYSTAYRRRPHVKEAARDRRIRMDAKWPEKRKARNAVNNALRDGRLVRKPCEMCGRKKVEAHHADYSKPLTVQWFCKKHHTEVH